MPAPGTFGNAARNFNVHGPWRRTFDFSVFKDVRPWRESKRYFQLRGEFYNVLNMKNWGFTGGTGTSLFTGTFNQNLAGQPNRYGSLDQQAGQALSQLGVYMDLNAALNRNLYLLDPNSTSARLAQVALKFYF